MLRKILDILNKSRIVENILFTEADVLENAHLLKIRAKLTNSRTLQIWEHKFGDLRRYSYHVFDNKDDIVVRWDNAPHHTKIKTFPHHKHEKVIESEEMDVEKTIKELEKIIK